MKSVLKLSCFCILASIAQAAHINIENENQNQNLEKNYRKENDAMDNLGDAVDALVKAAKIAIDQSVDEIDSKINDAIESNTDNFEEKLKGIQDEIEIQKSRQILTNKTIESQKMEIDKTQELLEDKSATITAKLEDFSEKLEDIQQKIAKQILLQKLTNKTLDENKLQVERVETDLESKTSELKTNLETQSQNFQEEVDELKSLQKETSKIIDQKIETHIEKNIDPKIVKLEEDFGKQLVSLETKIENQQKVLENRTNEKINQNEILIEKSLDTAEKKITDQRLAQIDQLKQTFNTQITGLEENFERKLKSMEETIENLNNDKVKYEASIESMEMQIETLKEKINSTSLQSNEGRFTTTPVPSFWG